MGLIHNKVGPPVEGDDFFGRDRELVNAWEDLNDGNHLLISAPRRIGKSSLVKRLVKDARDRGWKAAYIDVQGVTDELGFFKLFVETLKKENEGWFSKMKGKTLESIDSLLSKIEFELKAGEGSVKFKWSGTQPVSILEQLGKLLEGTGDCLIAIDELPFFLARISNGEDGRQRLSDFLHWLRAYRQRDEKYLRWIFCGSIGLDTFTEKYRLSEAFNDVLVCDIGAFDEDTAKAFLVKLGHDNQLPLTEENCCQILELIGWPLPFFLQAHFKQLKRLCGKGGFKAITGREVRQAYADIVDNTPPLRSWEERLDEQLKPEDSACCKLLLTAICRDKKGIRRKQLLDILYSRSPDPEQNEVRLSFCLKILERDGYLVCDTRCYSFRSPLLRDYWYKIKVK